MENFEIQSEPKFRGYSLNTLNIIQMPPRSHDVATTLYTITPIHTANDQPVAKLQQIIINYIQLSYNL